MTTSAGWSQAGGIAGWVAHWAKVTPKNECLVFEGASLNWTEFDALVDRFAGALADRGVGRADRVGCLMHNRPEYLVAFWATLRLGAVFVPYNVRLVARELAFVVGDSTPKIVLTDADFTDVWASVREAGSLPCLLVDVDADGLAQSDASASAASPIATPVPMLDLAAPAAILYTSGTTGRPKGVVLTHGNLLFQTLSWILEFGLTGRDRHLNFLPLCFTGGLLSATLCIVHTGAVYVLERTFDAARAVGLIEQQRITWLTSTPHLIDRMLRDSVAKHTDFSTLGTIESGGSAVPPALVELAATFGIELVQGYGLTEGSGAVVTNLKSADITRKIGSCGRASAYFEIRIVDEAGRDVAPNERGELLVRGPAVMEGYWNAPEATAEALRDGWLHTGDLAVRDEEGYVTLRGRMKDKIITGGLNVDPVEVENVIGDFKEVAMVSVVGIPDERWGEMVCAFVVLQPGAELAAGELIDRCRPLMADYRIPKRVVYVDALPRTTSGKVMRHALRALWEEGVR